MAEMDLCRAAVFALGLTHLPGCGGVPAVGLASSEGPRSREPGVAGSAAMEQRPRFSADGAAGEEALGESLVAFHFDAGGPPSGPPAVGLDGRVYIATTESYVHGLAADGTFLFSYTLPQRLEGGLVTDRQGVVYAAAKGGRFYALRPDGPLLWTLKLPVRPSTELAPGPHGWFMFAAHDRNVYGVSRQGVARWRSTIGKNIVATPALDAKGRAVVGTTDGFLYALEPFQRRYRVDLGAPILSAPRLGPDGTLWVVAGTTLYALDQKLAVRLRRPGAVAVAPWVGGAVVLGVDGELAWLRPDGTVTAQRRVARPGHELAVDAAATAYVSQEEGALAVVPAAGEAWRVRVGRAPIRAIVHDPTRNRMVALADDGRLAVVKAWRPRSSR